MCTKADLNKLRIFYSNLKSMGLSYFIPIIIIFFYIPVMLYLFYLNGNNDIEYAKYSIFAEMQCIIPFFSIWWLIFALREYIEGKSRELLKVYKKLLMFDSSVIFIWYVLHITLIILIMSIIFGDNLFVMLVLLVIQSSAFYSVAFLLMVICKTISVPLLTATVYEIVYMYMDVNFANLNIVYRDNIGSISNILIPYGAILIVSIFLFCVGNLIYKYRQIY